MKTYLFVYLGSLALAAMFTPIVILIARTLNIYDDINVRKIHGRAVPRIGGVSIVLAMLGLTLPVLMINNEIGHAFRTIQDKVLVLLAGSVFIFLIGLLDDVRRVPVRMKLLAQTTAALAVCAFGLRIEFIALADWFILDLGWFSWPFTVLWIVGITNAVNLIDGLDGLAAGICAIACAVIAVFSIYTGQMVMAVLMLALLGSLTGFLFFNFNPARVFMGDCGSLFLGFMLAASSVLSTTKSFTLVGLALPALALGIPIFDTLFSMLRRFLERRSIFSADRSHIHHKLLDMGLHQRHVVLLIYLLTLLVTGVGMFMMATRNLGTLLIFGGALALLVLVFRLFGAVGLRDTLAALQRRRNIDQQAKDHRRDFERAQLQLRHADNFDRWWKGVQKAAEKMDFAWIILPLQTRDGTRKTLLWRRKGPVPPDEKLLEITLPLRQRRSEEILRMILAIQVNGSLESAGNRVALFSRLIDEHGLEDLPPIEPEILHLPQITEYSGEQEEITEIKRDIITQMVNNTSEIQEL
ncbi:MAG: undecaprenyl/decaprenyl-phosphate alpha-N-acetylglucosaminyl 1-phosphate transferase [Sedimentisphaerales bacterium]|nr:undecaprenyl/decaprenyl-phosphate alpha-N-acetylglucosaminyl 1-phosphate transferase [Sedimentisphaerales bacterium]